MFPLQFQICFKTLQYVHSELCIVQFEHDTKEWNVLLNKK